MRTSSRDPRAEVETHLKLHPRRPHPAGSASPCVPRPMATTRTPATYKGVGTLATCLWSGGCQ
eukprot:7115103-Alexandrium_andersonii.AAC.1